VIVEHSTHLACPPEKCFRELKTTRLFEFVSWPIVRFDPVDPPQFPRTWEERTYLVRASVFGLIPVGRQRIDITGRNRSGETRSFFVELRDNGRGTLVSKWDHVITVREADTGCLYTDRVEIEAGLLTPLVTAFAWCFYRHRQRRWRQLVASGFVYA